MLYVAHITLGRGQNIGVAAIKIVAVDTITCGGALGDQGGLGWVGDIVNRQAVVEFRLAVGTLMLLVDYHQVIGDADLVRMPALGHFDVGQRPGIGRISHIGHGGAVRVTHIADIKRRAVNPDLTAAGTIDVGDLPGVDSLDHQCDLGGSSGISAAFQAPKPPSIWHTGAKPIS